MITPSPNHPPQHCCAVDLSMLYHAASAYFTGFCGEGWAWRVRRASVRSSLGVTLGVFPYSLDR
jgi:hypothetical protein